jgi:hypothetical protein
MAKIPKRVLKIAQGLKHGQPPRRFRVRAILKWFGASRRGSAILSEAQVTLANMGLKTEPALDEAGIDDQVRIVQISESQSAVLPHAPEGDPTSDQVATSVTPTHGNEQPPGETLNGDGDGDDELEADQDEEQPTTKPDDRPVISQISDWTISSLRDKLDRGNLLSSPSFSGSMSGLRDPNCHLV